METEFTHFQQAMQLYRRVRRKEKKNTRGIGTVLGKYLYLLTTEFSEILKSGTKEVQHIIGLVNYLRNDF